MTCLPPDDSSSAGGAPTSARERILDAAFALLQERGYSATSTRDIAARARVSKRELYSEFGSKEGIYGALIERRAARMRQPIEAAAIDDRSTLVATLRAVGLAFLQLICDPAVVSIFRLAISGAEDAPDLSRVLEHHARAPYRRALAKLMARFRSAGLVSGAPAELAGRFVALLLTGELQVGLLLGLKAPPSSAQLERRVRAATEAFLALHGTGGG